MNRFDIRMFFLSMTAVAVFPVAASADLREVPWIGDGRPDREEADWYAEDPAPEFRAEFVLPEGMTNATLRFACAGFGWVRSGKGGALMDPSGLQTLWSVYDKTVYSHTFASLKVGAAPTSAPDRSDGVFFDPYPATNTVYVRLGNGFYNLPPLRFWGRRCFRNALAHGRPCFKLAIDGVDGPLAWKWRTTDVLVNSVYLGTEVDATRPEDTAWRPAAAVAGPKGEIVDWPGANPQTDVQAVQTGTARWLREGVQVVDFGFNSSAVPCFFFDGETRGTHIEIVYGERLNADGSVNVLTQTAGQIKRPGYGGPGAPAVACQRDVYVCRGEKDRFRPPFTWHIFRYAEIRGAKNLLGPGNAGRDVVSMLSLGDRTSAEKDFRTSDRRLQAIHDLCRRTFQANLIGGVQSDCPGRERLGYGGDIVSTYEAYMLNFDMREIYLKVLRDFADEAADDGWITETAPHVGIADRGFGGRAGPVSWALAVPELIDGLLRHYAEERALAYYPVCARYVRLVDAAHPDGLIPRCIGDHEALERAPDGVTATAHWYRFTSLTASFARRLGKTDDAASFDAIARKTRAAFVRAYVKDGVVADGTQSAQAIGLYLGLVPDAARDAAFRRLVAAVEEKGCAPHTGIFSTRYMLLVLSENGRLDLARRIVLHEGFPGWLHMIARGATTLWETWKESENVFSNCHPMFGSVDEWIIRYGGVEEIPCGNENRKEKKP